MKTGQVDNSSAQGGRRRAWAASLHPGVAPRQPAAGAGAFDDEPEVLAAAAFVAAAGFVIVVPEEPFAAALGDSALWSAVRLALPEPDRESVR